MHLGLSEKTLSEFIIDLSKGKRSVKEFQSSLNKNGAELPAALVETIWNIIQRLMPAQSKQGPSAPGAGGKYSGLSIPDARCAAGKFADISNGYVGLLQLAHPIADALRDDADAWSCICQ